MHKLLPYIFTLLVLGTLATTATNGGTPSNAISLGESLLQAEHHTARRHQTDSQSGISDRLSSPLPFYSSDTLQPAPVDTLRGETADEQFRALFIEAVRQRLLNNDAEALALIQQCQQLRPEAAEVFYLLYDYYNDRKDTPRALHNIRQACTLDTANVRYLQSLAQQLLRAQQYEECVPVIEKISQLLRTDTETLEVLYSLYKMLDNGEKALATLNRIEAIDGSKLDVTLYKMNLLEGMGRQQEAFEEMKKLIADHPYDYNLPVLAGNWLMGHDRQDEAYAYYTSVLNDEPFHEEALLALVDYYEETQQQQQADSLRERMLFSRKISNDTRSKLLNQHIIADMQQQRDSITTLAYAYRVVESDPTNVALRRQVAAYMQFKDMDSTLLQQQLDTILQLDPTDTWARVVTIQNTWPTGNYDKVVQLATEGTQYVPDEMAFYYFLGLAYYNRDDHDKALDALQRGTSQINENSEEEFVADFYAMMGDIYHEKHLDTKAFEAYDSCLQWKPDHISALNNYAYYLSQKGTDLDKAERMSRKTVDAEPDNAVYLDTYAWVLFCQKRYEEAATYMEKALANTNDTSGIYHEHAGDIYAMLGQTDKAVGHWQQALHMNPDNKLLKKKIKRRQYLTK